MRTRLAQSKLDTPRALALVETALVEAMRGRKLRSLLESLMPKRYIGELAQYLRVAMLLRAGLSYRGIEDATSTSAKTIAAVDRWLRRENPHYRRLYPIRHKRRHRDAGRFSDVAQSVWPFNYAGQVKTLFGMDPRQK